MIDADDITILSTEDYIRQTTEIACAIRDLLNDYELLTKKFITDKNMTKQEVADYLRCTTTSIPKEIPRIRWGNSILFKMSDIQKFIDNHKYSTQGVKA